MQITSSYIWVGALRKEKQRETIRVLGQDIIYSKKLKMEFD